MSIQAKIIKAVTRRTIKRHGLNQEQLVRHLRKAFNNTPTITLLPRKVTLKQIREPQFEGDHLGVSNPSTTVLYLHGGAYIGGVTRTYHNLAGRLAKQLHGEVYLPVYPFAPEHPFPEAVNRVMEAYEYLLALGKNPSDIVIAGDSAGGGLTMATMVALRYMGEPMPAAAFCISPWVDLECTGETMTSKAEVDPFIQKERLGMMARLYVGDRDLRAPLASPIYADLRGLPPLLIQVGTAETLLDDSTRLADKAKASGVKVELDIWEDMIHVWPIFAPILPEGQRAIERIGEFVRQQIK